MRKVLPLLLPVLMFFGTVTLPATPAVAHPTGDPWEHTYTHKNPLLVCLRYKETPGHRVPNYEDGYTYATGNGYYGAYQYRPSTWASAARATGYPYLSYTLPNRISERYQDEVTYRYYLMTHGSPWAYECGRR